MLADHTTVHELADRLGGVAVLGCLPGSPAERAGFRYGDIVLEIGGRSTPDMDAYFEAFRQAPEDPVCVRIFRDRGELELRIDRRTWQPPSPKEAAGQAAARGAFVPPDEEDESAPKLN
jgi:S1-C subfamily serine protease